MTDASPLAWLALALALTSLVSHTGHAQPVADTTRDSAGRAPRDALRGAWISGAVGLDGDGSKFVASVGVHVQVNRVVITGRKDTHGPGDPRVADAMGLLIGVAANRGPGAAVISAGLSHVDVTGYFDRKLGAHRRAIGMTLAGDVALRAGSRAGAGLGLTGFAHLNKAESFGGVGLQLTIGRWR